MFLFLTCATIGQFQQLDSVSTKSFEYEMIPLLFLLVQILCICVIISSPSAIFSAVFPVYA